MSGDIRRARSVVDIMRREGVVPTDIILCSLLNTCREVKDLDQAFEIFNLYRSRSWRWGDGVSSPLPSASAFEILLDICEDVGDERRALQVTDEMKQRSVFRQKIAV